MDSWTDGQTDSWRVVPSRHSFTRHCEEGPKGPTKQSGRRVIDPWPPDCFAPSGGRRPPLQALAMTRPESPATHDP
jgi:hypothetical protein